MSTSIKYSSSSTCDNILGSMRIRLFGQERLHDAHMLLLNS